MIINRFRVPVCIRNEILNILIGNRDRFLSNRGNIRAFNFEEKGCEVKREGNK